MSNNLQILESENVQVLRSHQEFADDVLVGLSRVRKKLSSKYIYDEQGSRLFSEIMTLPEYYLTRCEAEIFQLHEGAISQLVGGDKFNLVELGAGDGKKTRILLQKFLEDNLNFRYVPIDISENALCELTSVLNNDFPDLEIYGLVSDYLQGLKWLSVQNHRRSVILFLGSNIGNFDPVGMDLFLSNMRDACDSEDMVLIGFDLKKDIDIISKAYSDPGGVTARFNLNLLERINRELGGTFDTDAFRFYSTWDAQDGAIRSYLISLKDQTVRIEELGRSIHFKTWEAIHTESSFKFSEDQIASAAERNGFKVVENYYDSKKYFVDSLWCAQ